MTPPRAAAVLAVVALLVVHVVAAVAAPTSPPHFDADTTAAATGAETDEMPSVHLMRRSGDDATDMILSDGVDVDATPEDDGYADSDVTPPDVGHRRNDPGVTDTILTDGSDVDFDDDGDGDGGGANSASPFAPDADPATVMAPWSIAVVSIVGAIIVGVAGYYVWQKWTEIRACCGCAPGEYRRP